MDEAEKELDEIKNQGKGKIKRSNQSNIDISIDEIE